MNLTSHLELKTPSKLCKFKKGIKNVPKCEFPPSIVPAASISGTMSTALMLDYIERVLRPRVVSRVGSGQRTLLVMDAFAAHSTKPVLDALNALDIVPLILPGIFCLD